MLHVDSSVSTLLPQREHNVLRHTVSVSDVILFLQCLHQPRLPYLQKQWKEAVLFERKLPLFCACSCHVQNLDSDHLIRVPFLIQVSSTTRARVDNSCCVGFSHIQLCVVHCSDTTCPQHLWENARSVISWKNERLLLSSPTVTFSLRKTMWAWCSLLLFILVDLFMNFVSLKHSHTMKSCHFIVTVRTVYSWIVNASCWSSDWKQTPNSGYESSFFLAHLLHKISFNSSVIDGTALQTLLFLVMRN